MEKQETDSEPIEEAKEPVMMKLSEVAKRHFAIEIMNGTFTRIKYKKLLVARFYVAEYLKASVDQCVFRHLEHASTISLEGFSRSDILLDHDDCDSYKVVVMVNGKEEK